jgi:hypothetical protein
MLRLFSLALLATCLVAALSAQATHSLTTTYAGNTTLGASTPMLAAFDITTGAVPINIVQFDTNHGVAGNHDFLVYYKAGSMVGYHNQQSAWTLHATVSNINSPGPGQATAIPLPSPIQLAANSTYGFAVGATANSPRYSSGTYTNPVSDSNIVIDLYGIIGGFSSFTQPRGWNGTVWYELAGMIVEAPPSSRPLVEPNDQGPGDNGVVAGEFTIQNPGLSGAQVLAIELTASGTGNDAADYSEVALYWDSNDNGTFDFGTDTPVESFTAFPGDDGTLTFNVPAADQDFPTNTTRTYFIVVKMSGSGAQAATFDFTVSDIITNQGTGKSGVPSALIEGVQIKAPALEVQAITGSRVLAFAHETGAGGNGIEVARFIVHSNDLAGARMEGIEVTHLGSANGAADIAEVAIYRESNTTAGFQGGANGDTRIDAVSAFPTPNGALIFNVSGTAQQEFGISESREYYIVLKLNGNGVPTATFDFQVTDLVVAATLKPNLPSAVMEGLLIRTPEFVVNDTTPATGPVQVPVGMQGVVMQTFSVSYPGGPNNNFGIVQLRGSGSGHEVAHLSSVELWLDDNGNQQLDGSDVLLTSATFALDNGQVNLTFSGQPNFAVSDTRHYLIVYNFNLNAPHGATFQTHVHNLGSLLLSGTDVVGVPAPGTAGTPGVEINANILHVTLNGPSTATPVDSDSHGPHGDGELLLDVTFLASIEDWTVSDITFEAAGTAAHDTAYSELALYQDNGSGNWDGSAVDTLAAATLSGFDSAGQATFSLTNSLMTTGQPRRMYLVGKLAGVARAGQTLNARILSLNASSSTAGLPLGVPSNPSAALVIDVSVMTIGLGVNPPAATVRRAGTPFSHAMGKFRLTAVNDQYSVNSIQFTTGGTADWAQDLEAGTGVRVYRDNGDGNFDPASDQLLYEGPGAASVMAAFNPPLVVPNAGEVVVWFVINGSATTGQGAAAAPLTFSVSIANANHVAAPGTKVLGSPAPNSATLGVVDFFVSSFTPLLDAPAGGSPITLEGSGFMSPFTVRIGGVLCPGTASLASGTRATGLSVPAGTAGKGIPIEVSSAGLPPETLSQTFSYGFAQGRSSPGGCNALATTGVIWALLALALVGFATLRVRAIRA